MNAPDPEQIDPRHLKPGPIRHESLPANLLEQIKAVHDVVGPFLDISLEQFEVNFMRDSHPEKELAVWCIITTAWIDYHEQHLDDEYLSADEEKKLLGALILISTGVDDVGSLQVPADVGTKLLACYNALGKQ